MIRSLDGRAISPRRECCSLRDVSVVPPPQALVMSNVGAAAAFAAGAAVAWVVRSKSGRNLLPTDTDPAVHARVKELVAQTKIVVFSKTYCPFCRKVKALLAELGIPADDMAIVELDISADGAQIQAALLEMTKQKTVPNARVERG